MSAGWWFGWIIGAAVALLLLVVTKLVGIEWASPIWILKSMEQHARAINVRINREWEQAGPF